MFYVFSIQTQEHPDSLVVARATKSGWCTAADRRQAYGFTEEQATEFRDRLNRDGRCHGVDGGGRSWHVANTLERPALD